MFWRQIFIVVVRDVMTWWLKKNYGVQEADKRAIARLPPVTP